MKKYQVYKHTTPDGAAYIGKTCNRKRRDIQHKYCKKVTPLTEAIAKYGWDAMTHETIADGLTDEEANDLEIAAIKRFDTLYPNGLNLHKGGEIVFRNPREIVNAEYKKDRPIHTRVKRPAKPKKKINEKVEIRRRERLKAKKKELKEDIKWARFISNPHKT